MFKYHMTLREGGAQSVRVPSHGTWAGKIWGEIDEKTKNP